MSSHTAETLRLSYWEERARRYAGEGTGLRAVCSYGMPLFYNHGIHWCQRLALRPWLGVEPGTRVLDVGCGVGRWSLELAARGARVVGIDLSPTMVRVASERAEREGRGTTCEFRQGDVTRLEVDGPFDLILAVTVLQHLRDDLELDRAFTRLSSLLGPRGRLVLLEAAPRLSGERTEHGHLRIRDEAAYRSAAESVGLRLEAITGVDLFPLKKFFLPLYSRLPRLIADIGLAGMTGVILPAELALGRRWVAASWHKVMVFGHPDIAR